MAPWRATHCQVSYKSLIILYWSVLKNTCLVINFQRVITLRVDPQNLKTDFQTQDWSHWHSVLMIESVTRKSLLFFLNSPQNQIPYCNSIPYRIFLPSHPASLVDRSFFPGPFSEKVLMFSAAGLLVLPVFVTSPVSTGYLPQCPALLSRT